MAMTPTTCSMVMATTPIYLNSNCFLAIQSRMDVLKNISSTRTTTKGVGSSRRRFRYPRNGKYRARNRTQSPMHIPWTEETYLSRSPSNLIMAVEKEPYARFRVRKMDITPSHDS